MSYFSAARQCGSAVLCYAQLLSCFWLFATPWLYGPPGSMPLSMGILLLSPSIHMHEHGVGCHARLRGNLPDRGVTPRTSCTAGEFFPNRTARDARESALCPHTPPPSGACLPSHPSPLVITEHRAEPPALSSGFPLLSPWSEPTFSNISRLLVVET